MRVYLDTNAIQRAADMFPSGPRFEGVLDAAGFQLGLGFHVIYELARAFTTGRQNTVLCLRVLAQMERIHHIPQPKDLIRNEVDRLLHGGKVLDVVPLELASLIKFELYRMSCGHIEEARRFIANREKRFEADQPRIAQTNRAMIHELIKRNSSLRPALRTWEVFRQALRPLWPALIERTTGTLPRGLVDVVFQRPQDFPVLNTWLNIQLHLQYLAWSEENLPGRGRVDDYRNVLESNAADLFVTADDKLLKRYATVNPFRPSISWDDFLAKLPAAVAVP